MGDVAACASAVEVSCEPQRFKSSSSSFKVRIVTAPGVGETRTKEERRKGGRRSISL